MKTMSPNDFGKIFTVEECGKVSVSSYLQDFKKKLREAVTGSSIEIEGRSIELTTSQTGFGGIRYWFKCPICSKRVGVLFVHSFTRDVGCRLCLDLDYRKRRFKGMAEGEIK